LSAIVRRQSAWSKGLRAAGQGRGEKGNGARAARGGQSAEAEAHGARRGGWFPGSGLRAHPLPLALGRHPPPAREITATKRPDRARKKRVPAPVAGWATGQPNARVIDLDPNLEAFYAMAPALAPDHEGHWVIFREGRPVGFYGAREDAVEMAGIRFGRASCLIRQIVTGGWVRGRAEVAADQR